MQGMPNQAELRIPTQSWSGYGFSNSSPSPIAQSNQSRDETITVSLLFFLYIMRLTHSWIIRLIRVSRTLLKMNLVTTNPFSMTQSKVASIILLAIISTQLLVLYSMLLLRPITLTYHLFWQWLIYRNIYVSFSKMIVSGWMQSCPVGWTSSVLRLGWPCDRRTPRELDRSW